MGDFLTNPSPTLPEMKTGTRMPNIAELRKDNVFKEDFNEALLRDLDLREGLRPLLYDGSNNPRPDIYAAATGLRTDVDAATTALAALQGNASALPVIATGSTTPRPLSQRASAVFNVCDFGAKSDGSADATAAVQLAINAAQAAAVAGTITRGAVYFPAGTYRVDGQLSITLGLEMYGDGAELVLGYAGGEALSAVWTPTGGSESQRDRLSIHDLSFRRSVFGANTTGLLYVSRWPAVEVRCLKAWGLGGAVIRTGFVSHLAVHDVRVSEHFASDLIRLETSIPLNEAVAQKPYVVEVSNSFLQWTAPQRGLWSCIKGGATNLTVNHSALQHGAYGLRLSADSYATTLHNNFIEECTVGVQVGEDVGAGYLSQHDGVSIRGNLFTVSGTLAPTATGIRIGGAVRGLAIEDNVFDDNQRKPVDFASPSNGRVSMRRNAMRSPLAQIAGTPNIDGDVQVARDVVCVDACALLDANNWGASFADIPGGFTRADVDSAEVGRRCLQVTLADTYGDLVKTIPAADFSAADYFVVALYLDDVTRLRMAADFFILYMASSGGNEYRWLRSKAHTVQTNFLRSGWQYIVLRKADASSAGAPNWASITSIKLGMAPASGQTLVARFGGVWAVRMRGTPASSEGATLAARGLASQAGSVLHGSSKGVPTTGTWRAGTILWNEAPAAAGKVGWVCTASGTPGTWKAFGAIDA
jgi:hypothetical protein